MKPYLHGLVSAKKFGGQPEDYQKIHDWFDQGKAHVADMRHRALLHHSLGIYICEQVFGVNITNSDGKLVSVRDVGEQHVLDDLGTIPSVQDYLKELPWLDWLGGPKRAKGVKADEVKPAAEEKVFAGAREPSALEKILTPAQQPAYPGGILDMIQQQKRIDDLNKMLQPMRADKPLLTLPYTTD